MKRLGYKTFGSVKSKMHPDHCRNCGVLRSLGWKWSRRARVWHLTNDWLMVFRTAWEAYDWCLTYGEH